MPITDSDLAELKRLAAALLERVEAMEATYKTEQDRPERAGGAPVRLTRMR